MKIATPKQMNEIDSYAINKLGIPGIVLMENAAAKVVGEITAECGGSVAGKKILLLAGKGNNGGDAFAAARILDAAGAKVSLFVLARRNEISGDARINLDKLENTGIKVKELLEERQVALLNASLPDSELVIDGIFGTGFGGKPEGIIKAAIEAVNNSDKPVISIDIPSGVNGETGEVPGACIKADITVTFCLPKPGMILHPGCEQVGRLVVADIGIPSEAIEQMNINKHVIDNKLVAGIIPKRFNDSSKGDYGKVFIITGSTGMTGSGCLCANATMRSGAGLVYVGVPAGLSTIYSTKLTEPIIIALQDNGNGSLSAAGSEQIINVMDRMDSVAIGPGLSVNDEIIEVVRNVIKESRIPLVLDADALNAVARDVSMLKECKAEIVITPHPGEMARLTGLSIREVRNDRLKVAADFAQRYGVIVVLKGAGTVVALPDGTIYINTTGNPGMATGGAGDVLTGIIVSLAGQGMKPADAAIAGVYLHGLAGDAAAGKKGMHGMIAGDIIEELPYVIKGLSGNKCAI